MESMRSTMTAFVLGLALAISGLFAPGALAQQVVVVRSGETLSEIADRYGISLSRLMQANGISDPDLVVVGQRISIPGRGGTTAPAGAARSSQPMAPYTVKSGETLSEIAARFNTSTERLMQANGISDPDLVVVGQRISIPGRGGTTAPAGAARSSQPMAPYTVKSGETLSEIATRFNTSTERLMQANGISNPDLVMSGTRLQVPLLPAKQPSAPPPPSSLSGPTANRQAADHVVQAGESLSLIAERYGTSVERLAALNQIDDPGLLLVGTRLRLRGTPPTAKATTKPRPTATAPATTAKAPSTAAATRPTTQTSTAAATRPTTQTSTAPTTATAPATTAKAPSTAAAARPTTQTSTAAATRPTTQTSTAPTTATALATTAKAPSTAAAARPTTQASTAAATRPTTQTSTAPATTATAPATTAKAPSTAAATRPTTQTQTSTAAATRPTTQTSTAPTTATAPATTAKAPSTAAAARPTTQASAAASGVTPSSSGLTNSSTLAQRQNKPITPTPQANPVSQTNQTNPAGGSSRLAQATNAVASSRGTSATISTTSRASAAAPAVNTPTGTPNVSSSSTSAGRTRLAARPAASASSQGASSIARASEGDWRSYGPLQVDWSKLQPMGGSYVAPSVNNEGQTLYLAVNCTARKINVTSLSGQWKTWETPSKDFEHSLVRDVCQAKAS